LKALHTEDLPADRNYTIYAAVQIAYRRALLSREPNPNVQRAFLEDLLQRRSDQWVSGQIFSWALSELCNRGSLTSMHVIEKALEKGDRRSNIELIRGCEAEMTIVNSDPDRVKALGSALDRLTQEQTGTPLDRRLVIWATGQLSRDKSREAQAVRGKRLGAEGRFASRARTEGPGAGIRPAVGVSDLLDPRKAFTE